ncbi:MAG: YjjG family noncanonical pyrimidine nucleotidase [Oscillospiraceae bacterium]|jgi:YjjG family noncanonical pyrimidine nucleotidase|nr:YjjG family noncanonical pyrimidine nucleotidase [Oscillospiraceae bacterium]
MRKYRLLLADADDTLFDFTAAERAALRQALSAAGLPGDEAVYARYHHINRSLWALLERGEIRQNALRARRFELLLAELGLEGDVPAIAAAFTDALGQQAVPLPGAEQAVARWAARVPVIILTNGIAAVQRARLSRSLIGALVTGVVISDEVGAAKPDARMVQAALALAPHVPKAEVLLLGDSLSADMAAARNAGVDGCWLNPGGAPPAGLSPAYTIQSLDEVDALLV